MIDRIKNMHIDDYEKLPELPILHWITDRANEYKKEGIALLKAKMTLWSIVGHYMDTHEPEVLCCLIKVLVDDHQALETNLGEPGVHGFDAYFLPTGLLDRMIAYRNTPKP